jgi:hypothetical protein
MCDFQGRPSEQDHGQDLENIKSLHNQDVYRHEKASDSPPG